ncbi:phosphonate ABC transporter [cyanobiont of Ornithocercus magnificus]|nr:phosphonate ABC transporter [cyanobiont of Ornithocercus magnificus]
MPVTIGLLPGWHSGGAQIWIQFLKAAFTPSMDVVVLSSVLNGIQITAAMALLSWSLSLIAGTILALPCSCLLWRYLGFPACLGVLLRRVLTLPRAIHELVWGLLLLQTFGLNLWAAVLAISVPYASTVARVVSDQLDHLDPRPICAFQQQGASPQAMLLTAVLPSLLPRLCIYGSYQLECALRSATVLGVFGLGGLGTDLQLTLQSLQFQEFWTALWPLIAVSFTLEKLLAIWRYKTKFKEVPLKQLLWLAPITLVLTIASGAWLCLLQPDLTHIPSWSPPPLPTASGIISAYHALPWITLVIETLLLTIIATGVAIGLPPLLMLLLQNIGCRHILNTCWIFLRLLPVPLISLLLLLSNKPNIAVAALALGLHNASVMGRFLGESLDNVRPVYQQVLGVSGARQHQAWLYGSLVPEAPLYLAYGAQRMDAILRETAIVGLVAGSGLGRQLVESLSFFAWSEVTLLLLVFTILTLSGELISEWARPQWQGQSGLRS